MFANVNFELLPQLGFGLHEVSQFGAKSLWKFYSRFEFSEIDLSKFTGFKVNEWPQSLSQFEF
ncbi:hypothetical protein DYA89_17610 [Vibrio cholerae]|nr:hypothetical protein [Vibrio cholerae]POB08042.1 hypothetical protein CRN33_05410 [Vibrio vulnificus]